METKDLIALALMFVAVLGGITVTSLSQRARDAAFFLMVAGMTVTHKLDINFLSQYWYRGTTRGLEFSFVDVLAISVLAGCLLAPRHDQKRWFWPASLGLMLLFFGYACASVATSEPKLYGAFELSKMLRGIVVFAAAAMFVRTEREVGILVFALCCAVCFEGALAVKQRYLDGIHRVTGSLEHPNSLSMYLCMVSPVLLAAALSTLPKLMRYFCAAAVGAACVGLLLSISRAGIPIFAFVLLGTAAFCVSWRITVKKIAVAALVVVGIAAALYNSWDTLKDRYAEATFEAEYLDDKTEGRGYYLRMAAAIVNDRFFGVGLNNWSYWVSKRYGAWLETPYEDYDDLDTAPNKDDVESFNYAAPAHNLGALTVGELGVPGLLLFGLLWLRWFEMGARFLWKRTPEVLHRLGVGLFFGTCGIFLQSVTEWTYRQTHILFTFHVLLGVLASLCWFKRRAARQVARRRVEEQREELEHEPVVA